MAREVIIRCDKCASSDDAEEFTVTRNGETRTVAACGEHKGPLVELYDLGQVEERPKRGRKKAVHSVVPVEDLGIEPPK